MSAEDEGFFSRWSRRKRDAEARAEAEPPAPPAAAAPAPAEDAPRTDEEILEALGLPDPDTLQPGDDFAAFLRAGAPAHLQRRALRRLWASNPVLANLDGLNDYDGDFTGGSVASGALQTAYRIGRGFLSDAEPAPGRRAPPSAEEGGAEEAAPEADSLSISVISSAEMEVVEENAAKEHETHIEPTRKRMSFRFPDES